MRKKQTAIHVKNEERIAMKNKESVQRVEDKVARIRKVHKCQKHFSGILKVKRETGSVIMLWY